MAHIRKVPRMEYNLTLNAEEMSIITVALNVYADTPNQTHEQRDIKRLENELWDELTEVSLEP